MAGKGLLPLQRQEEIFRILATRGFASVSELAGEIAVSDMTVRRDLDALAERGRVQRVFGGARVRDQSASEVLYTERLERDRAAKEAMARLASTLVRDGDSIALDASTTAVYLARELRERPVTVVTNSLLVARELGGGGQLIVLGGTYRPVARSLVGPMTENDADGLHVDRVFFSGKGVEAEAGVTDSHLEEVAVKRALIRGAAHVVAVTDHSKFGRVALHTVARLDRIDTLVTDAAPPKKIASVLERGDAEVLVAGD